MHACANCKLALAKKLVSLTSGAARATGTAVQTASAELIKYPEVVPQYPPGESWEGLQPKHAWMFHEEALKIKQLPTVQEKLDAIRFDNLWKSSLKLYPWQHIPSQGYEFVKYVTKTHVLSELPEVWLPTVPEELSNSLRPALEQALHVELDKKKDDLFHSGATTRKALLRALRQLLMLSAAAASGVNPQLTTARIAADVKVRCFYKRFGWASEHLRGKPETAPPVIRVQAHFRNALQMQIPLPLPEVVAIDSDLVLESPEPEYDYRPTCAAQFTGREAPTMFPGHWLQDPCPFGLFSLPLFYTEEERASQQFEEPALNKLNMSAGIVSAFSMALAQAAYQGFPYPNELLYPFVQQTLLCDGRGSFCLFVYQLNTVHLHKPASANRRKNLCWVSPWFRLWDENLHVSAEGVGLWLRMFMKQGVARENPRPYLAEAARDHEHLLVAARDPNQPPETRSRIHRYLNT